MEQNDQSQLDNYANSKEKEIEDLKRELADSQTQVRKMEHQAKSNEEEMNSLKIANSELKADNTVMIDEADSLKRQLEEYNTLNVLLGHSEEDNQSLITELKMKSEEIKILKTKLMEQQAEMAKMECEMKLKSAEIEILKTSRENAELKLKCVKTQMEGEIKLRAKDIEDLKDNDSFNPSLNGEDENELIGDGSDSLDEDVEKEHNDQSTSDTSKGTDNGTLSRPLKYTVSLHESLMKLTIKTEKKIDNVNADESSSKPSRKGMAKINDKDLECPKCEYRSRVAQEYTKHLRTVHLTTIRELGLALLCACGKECFSYHHNTTCDESNVTVISKKKSPQCVMCEAYPKTPRGYTDHLSEHGSSLMKLKLFIKCSCGIKVYTSKDIIHNNTPQKCNGHEYTLHKVDDE